MSSTNISATQIKRCHKIKALLDRGHSQTKIAEIIGVHKSTISCELSRNIPTRGCSANEYRPELAQRKTTQCHRTKRKYIRFHDTTHPKKLSAKDVEVFFTYLANEANVAASTQTGASVKSGISKQELE